MNIPTTKPSGKDDEGNIFLHFQKLPLRVNLAVGITGAKGQAWSWNVLGVGSGIDRPVFPECESRLREILAGSEAEAVGSLEVVRGIDDVKAELARECDVGLWDIYPQRGGREGCLVVAPTGRWGTGWW